MPWTLIFLLLTVLGLIVTYFKRKFTYWERCGIPCEPAVFPFGNLKGIGKTMHFRDINSRIYKKFKGKTPMVGTYFFFKEVAMILDLDLIKNILIKDFSNFRDRGVFSNPRDEPLTEHLFALDGEEWKVLRNKLSPVFTSGKMKFMFPTILNVSDNLIECCESLVAEDKDGALDLKELCARYTTDVIGTCAFGLECNSLKDANAEFRTMGRLLFEKPRHIPIIQAFMISNKEIARKLHMKFFNEDVSKFFMSAVRRTVEFREKNNVKRNDFMDMLMAMKTQDEESLKTGEHLSVSHGLTVQQIAAQAFVFFVAGFDTSSSTMAFCLYELALNQKIQDKLREEINSVLQKHNGQLTYEAMKEMEYLEKVLAETLRKYSVLPHLIRITKNDYKIPDTNYVLKANTSIIIPVAAIQMDPEYFPEPEKFDPSRFEPEEIEKRHQMSYLPFGDGPRNCIGMRFGKMQAKVGLINLIKHYKFTKSPKTEEPVVLDKRNFIISAINGIYLHVEKI